MQPAMAGPLLPHKLVVGRYAKGRWQTVRQDIIIHKAGGKQLVMIRVLEAS